MRRAASHGEETAKRQDLDRLAHCSASKLGFITVVGHAAMISAGEFLQASGGWVNDGGYWNRRLHKIVYADRISLLEERQ